MVDHRPLILKGSLASEIGVILPNFRFTCHEVAAKWDEEAL
jgi:hypothetical protein